MKKAILLFVICSTTIFISFSTPKHQHSTIETKETMKLIPVKDAVYMLEGRGGNIGVLVGKDGILLVDDQFSHMHDAIKYQLAKISNQEVKYLINTHWHVDHSDGNENFGKLGSTIIAHKNSRERMLSDQYIKVFNHHQQPYNNDGIPKIAFDNTMELHINKQTIHLISAKNAHTDGDLFVYFSESNVIHAGDIFVTYGYPFIDQPNGGSIQGVITAIDQMIALSNEQTRIIPGHGTLSNKNDLIAYRQMLATILSRIKTEFQKGKSLDEIIKTHPTRGFTSQKINEAIFVEIVLNNLKSTQNE